MRKLLAKRALLILRRLLIPRPHAVLNSLTARALLSSLDSLDPQPGAKRTRFFLALHQQRNQSMPGSTLGCAGPMAKKIRFKNCCSMASKTDVCYTWWRQSSGMYDGKWHRSPTTRQSWTTWSTQIIQLPITLLHRLAGLTVLRSAATQPAGIERWDPTNEPALSRRACHRMPK